MVETAQQGQIGCRRRAATVAGNDVMQITPGVRAITGLHRGSTAARLRTARVRGVDMPRVGCDDDRMVEASEPGGQGNPAPQEPGLRIALLGGVRIEVEPGVSVDPGPRKCQELLAALALHPREAVTVARLVDLLWDEHPPRTAEKTLQTYVARLRKALGPTAIARIGSAYRLDVDPAAIDTSRFRHALQHGETTAALAEWTGAPLAGIEADGLRPLVDGLVEQWLDAVEADLQDTVETDPGAATGRLTELVADYPFREGMWALLMTALYQTGRQAEALDAYRRARTNLVDHLGVEPGPRLRELEQRILRQDELLTAGVEPDHHRISRRRRSDRQIPTGTITFGFVELVDAATLWSDHASDAADIIAAFAQTTTAVAAHHGGTVFVSGTETLGIAFDSAVDAAAWAAALHHEVSTTRWPDDAPVAVRVGLHTGEADERNGSYYGPTVSLANRVAELGHPGQTVSTMVTALLSEETDQLELGSYAIDGVRQQQVIRQLGPGSFPPLRIGAQRRDSLPRPDNRLIGRDGLVATVATALADGPLVTLVGPGGVGKTRLAVEVTRRDRDAARNGAWFIELAEVAESADVARTIADAIGVQESSRQSVLDAIIGAMQNRTALVVLDNCEHVVDGVSEVLTAIVERCPGLTVLATSREGLGVSFERLIAVGPLDIDGSGVELFTERATTADPAFDIDQHRATIQAVCRRLDGVPLAIELAAARVKTMDPADLLARMDDSFRLLTGAKRGAIERHRTLRATMLWSYDLLSDNERRLFRRLAVFSGPFDLLAAERVVADELLQPTDVSVLIGDLVDRSMCTVGSGTTGRRFRLLEPMRQFALEELRLDGPDDDLRQRHAGHVRAQINRIRHLLAGKDEIAGAVALDEIWPNLRSAIDWAVDRNDLDLATDLLGPIVPQGFMRRGLGELRDWIERVMEIAGPDDDSTIADGLLWAALYSELTENRTDFDRLIDRFDQPDLVFARLAVLIANGESTEIINTMAEAMAEADRRDDPLMADLFRILTAGILLSSGRLDEAETNVLATMDRAEQTMPPTLLNWLRYLAATIRAIRGDTAGAETIYNQIVAMPLPPRTNSPNETLAARRAMAQGDHQLAYRILRDHIEELIIADNLNGAGVVALEFLTIMITAGQLSDAAFVLGFFDTSGILDVDGEGFKMLLFEPGETINADREAARVRAQVAAGNPNPRDALDHMAATLDRLMER